MNRKERRAAQKTAGPSLTPMAATLASAFRAHQAGHRSDAERLYRDVLAVEPRNAAALHLLGALMHQAGRSDEAISLMRQAIAIEPPNPDYQYNLGSVLNATGRMTEAIEHLSKAIALKPRYAEAHFELGNALAREGQFDAAEKSLRRTLELQPDNPNALNNLGLVLQHLGRLDEAVAIWERTVRSRPLAVLHLNIGIARKRQERLAEAEASLRQALALQPDYADASHRLAQVLLLQGRGDEALALANAALDGGETLERRATFVQSLLAATSFRPDATLRERLRRALAEAWWQPNALSRVAADVLKAHPVFGPAIQRVAAQWASASASRQTPVISDAEIASAAGEPLLHAFLEATPNFDVAMERFLTALRANLLDRVTSGSGVADGLLAFYAALAKQCFINEYVFSEFESETARIQQLTATLTPALAAVTPISPADILAFATYRPLHSLEHADRLLQQDWPEPVAAILRQQVREPSREQSLRASMPVLTAIDDATSAAVRDLYEQNPYPRWIATPQGTPLTIDELMEERFPPADRPAPVPVSAPDILIAGCGTGLQAIIAAQTYRDARILAVDMSLTSLAYARRKAEEAGLSNIEFAQADILNLGSLNRAFDIVEAIGVLHHLDDPYHGWSILLSLLRPGGLMKVGLYSELARQPVIAARDFAERGGYQADPEGIRRCRQDILRLPADRLATAVTTLPDFYTTSMFRDLVMHVAEHRTTLPAIRQFLDARGLNFVGFETEDHTRREFARRFPEPEARKNLDTWHAFEQDNPGAFIGMYNFWVQKPN